MKDLILLEERPNYFERIDGEVVDLEKGDEPSEESLLNIFKFIKLGEREKIIIISSDTEIHGDVFDEFSFFVFSPFFSFHCKGCKF